MQECRFKIVTTMDIKNPEGFAEYKQARVGDNLLAMSIEFAQRWADLSVQLSDEHGDKDRAMMGVWVGKAYEQVFPAFAGADAVTLKQTRDIMSQFWEHGKAFDAWFQTRVAEVMA